MELGVNSDVLARALSPVRSSWSLTTAPKEGWQRQHEEKKSCWSHLGLLSLRGLRRVWQWWQRPQDQMPKGVHRNIYCLIFPPWFHCVWKCFHKGMETVFGTAPLGKGMHLTLVGFFYIFELFARNKLLIIFLKKCMHKRLLFKNQSLLEEKSVWLKLLN